MDSESGKVWCTESMIVWQNFGRRIKHKRGDLIFENLLSLSTEQITVFIMDHDLCVSTWFTHLRLINIKIKLCRNVFVSSIPSFGPLTIPPYLSFFNPVRETRSSLLFTVLSIRSTLREQTLIKNHKLSPYLTSFEWIKTRIIWNHKIREVKE